MTRYDMKNSIQDKVMMSGMYTSDQLICIEDVVDEIYDDFENRTCGSCKHEDISSCPAYDYEYGLSPREPDFGCNKFSCKE